MIEGSQIVQLTTQGAYSPLVALSRNLNRYVREVSPDGVTAVNADGGAGDKIGSPGRQKDSGSDAFIGITKTAGCVRLKISWYNNSGGDPEAAVVRGAVKSVSIHPGELRSPEY